ncbi:hypothetical protein [Anaerorhabdus sp.]|uniref:hypothetical protein n=1 Tax=Anaerorhabdus sp. TaxID=1872524 RepID=UPI002FC7CF66
MNQSVKIVTDLNNFERIVLAYKDGEGVVHIAHSFFYNGRDGSEYLLFLYKDPLPKGNFVEGWNYLDENSVNTTIVGVHDHGVAVEDFLAAWDPTKIMSDVNFYQVKDFSEVDEMYDKIKIDNHQVVAFGILK